MRYLGAMAALALLVVGGDAAWSAESHTTVSEEMKITVELQIEAPSPCYDFDGKTLSWREVAENDSHYMRVIVRDKVVGAVVAGAAVDGVIMTLNDKVIGTSLTLHETWDRERAHYGANLQLGDDLTSGNVALKISPGKGRRLGRADGDFFTKPVTLKFDGVNFSTVKTKAAEADGETTGAGKVEWPKGRRPYVTPTPYPGAENAGRQQ